MPLDAIDRDDIRQLLARYCHTLDFGDVEGFLGCFAADAYFSTATGSRWEGTEALREFAEACSRHYVGHIRHVVTNILIEGDGDSARTSSYMYSSRDSGVPEGEGATPFSRILNSGIYQDRLVKSEGRWVFQERTYRYDGSPDTLARVDRPIVLGDLYPS